MEFIYSLRATHFLTSANVSGTGHVGVPLPLNLGQLVSVYDCDCDSINFALYSDKAVELKDFRVKKEVTCLLTCQWLA